ncbi:HAD family hydrolase [Bailinhaonella thermotolerans]|uniref:HAD family hydrolase n=1 Tax=Bailinhaonella thermotolerans TaxID=1070861 RepID=UPI00192A1944|nr:HAD family hydrolase [Bailinhaonella thermotolerans]
MPPARLRRPRLRRLRRPPRPHGRRPAPRPPRPVGPRRTTRRQETDPLEVLRFAATAGREVSDRIEAALRALEVQAVPCATPTPGTADVMATAHRAGKRLAVVSNNSDAAVKLYTDSHGLSGLIDVISARGMASDPGLLKPHPHLVRQAIEGLDADPATCVLVGDSTADILSAHSAGIPCIGYANKPGKADRLSTAGADTIITHMTDLLPATT